VQPEALILGQLHSRAYCTYKDVINDIHHKKY